MKKIICCIYAVFAALPAVLYGQAAPPAWTQDAWRDRQYPSSEWYTGFVRDRLAGGANMGKALKNAEKQALNQLAESIIVDIKGETETETTSNSQQQGKNRSEAIATNFRSAIKTATSATAVKSEVKSYCDPVTGYIYGFAAVRASALASFYARQLEQELSKVERMLDEKERLAAAGKKMSARRKCEDAQKTIAQAEYSVKLLSAVNPDADNETLQSSRLEDLHRQTAQALIDLEQSTFVFVQCKYEFRGYKDDAFGSDPNILCGIIKQAISENDCSITDNAAEADWEVRLSAYTTQRSDGSGEYGIITYYANVRGELWNRLTRKKVSSFALHNDPDAYAEGATPEIAATRAFKLPALRNKVLESILPKIKN